MEEVSQRMNAFYKLFIAVGFIGLQNSKANIDIELLNKYAETQALPKISAIGYFSDGNPNEVWKWYQRYYWQNRSNTKYSDLTKAIGSAIAENKGVAEIVTEKVENSTHQESDRDRFLLIYLGGIPAEWSVRILGKYLFDPRPMTNIPEGTLDYAPYASNDFYAAASLAALGFSDAPTKGPEPLIELNDEKIEQWRAWWKANEGRIAERIREINPDYKPIPGLKMVEPFPEAKSESETAATPASSPPLTHAEKVEASALESETLLYVGAGVGVLILLALVLVVVRRK